MSHAFDFVVWGINENGEPHDFPFKIIPAFNRLSGGDILGRLAFLLFLRKNPRRFSAVFMLQDSFVLSREMAEAGGRPFIEAVHAECQNQNIPLIVYFPIDAAPLTEWVEPLSEVDCAVTYTPWGQQACLKATHGDFEPHVIPHGVATQDFYPLDVQQRHAARARLTEKYDLAPDTFVTLYVGTNQRRKIIDWLMITWRELLKHRPNSFLVMHTTLQSPNCGWNMHQMTRQLGLERGRHWGTTLESRFMETFEMNELYSSADCLILPSAEGWGLPATEAMACKLPVILGDHAALSHIGGASSRALMIECPEDPNFIRIFACDNDVIRRMPCVHSGVKNLVRMSDEGYPDELDRIDKAFRWATNLDWSLIAEQWIALIDGQIRAKLANPISIYH